MAQLTFPVLGVLDNTPDSAQKDFKFQVARNNGRGRIELKTSKDRGVTYKVLVPEIISSTTAGSVLTVQDDGSAEWSRPKSNLVTVNGATLTVNRTMNLTGTSGTTYNLDDISINPGEVTLAMMANIDASAGVKVVGRSTASNGVPQVLSTSGTGNVAMTVSPTFTGTLAAAAVTAAAVTATSINGITITPGTGIMTLGNRTLALSGNITTSGAGYISTGSGSVTGGYIDTVSGGSIDTGGSGGNIHTRDGGGSISTEGTGSIGLGVTGTRTTFTGSATSNISIALPNAGGTVLLNDNTATITNKSIAATQLTGTIAAARITGSLTIPGAIGGTTPSTGAFTTLTATGVASVTDSTNATSTTSASIKTAGGIGIVKDAWFGGSMRFATNGAGGAGNIFLGSAAGRAGNGEMSTGAENVCIGSYAGSNLITGASSNVCIGNYAGSNLTVEAASNVCLGNQAGSALTSSSSHNMCIGYVALGSATSGANYNVAIGANSLFSVTNGDSNVGIGRNAGNTITTGTGNTFIGHDSDGVAGSQNQTAIGTGATCTAGNQVMLGRNWDAVVVPGTLEVNGSATLGLTGTAGGSLVLRGSTSGTATINTSATGVLALPSGTTATSMALTTPVLGTPTSGTLTNCTDLPVSGITASTTTAIGVGSINLGDVSDTTIQRVSAGVISVEGVTMLSQTNTLTGITNKTFTAPVLGDATGTSITVSDGVSVSGANGYIEASGANGFIEALGANAFIAGRSIRIWNGSQNTILAQSAATSDKTATFPNFTGTVAVTTHSATTTHAMFSAGAAGYTTRAITTADITPSAPTARAALTGPTNVIDYSVGTKQSATMSAAATISSFTGGSDGATLELWVKGGASDFVLKCTPPAASDSLIDLVTTGKTITANKIWVLGFKYFANITTPGWRLVSLVGGF